MTEPSNKQYIYLNQRQTVMYWHAVHIIKGIIKYEIFSARKKRGACDFFMKESRNRIRKVQF